MLDLRSCRTRRALLGNSALPQTYLLRELSAA